MPRLFGCHVSAAGGLENSIKNGEHLSVNSIQLHPAPPQQWNRNPFKTGVEERFLELRKQSGIKKVFFHGIYLINLANPDKEKWELSKKSLIHYLDLAARMRIDGVIFHVGSNKDQKIPQKGLRRAADAINSILDKSDNDAKLLLEVAAGSGKIIGSSTAELREIWDMVEDQKRVGFALDSQHMWASGYDFRNNLDDIVKEIKKNFGLSRVKCIHLNDSMTDLGSRRDRHENLGKGKIGQKALKAFINHPQLKKIPFILETPALKTLETAAPEVEVLRKWIS